MSKSLYYIWLPTSLLAHLVLIALVHFLPLAVAMSPEHVMHATLVEDGDMALTLPAPLSLVAPTPRRMIRPRAPKVATILGRMAREGSPIISRRVQDPSLTPGPRVPHRRLGPVGAGAAPLRSAAPAVLTGSHADDYPAQHLAPDGAGSAGAGTQAEGGGSGDGGESYPGTRVSVGMAFYPKDALNDDHEGTVVVSVSYDSDGHVLSAAVSSSSGYADLDAAAERGARKAKYRAGKAQGMLIGSSDDITYHFSHGKVTVD